MTRQARTEAARQLRATQTPAEAILWQALRDRQLGGYKFRRQMPIDRFIVDFCCVQPRVIIELDGAGHSQHEQAQYDQLRTEALVAQGYRVIRFSNDQIEQQLESVLQRIRQALAGHD